MVNARTDAGNQLRLTNLMDENDCWLCARCGTSVKKFPPLIKRTVIYEKDEQEHTELLTPCPACLKIQQYHAIELSADCRVTEIKFAG